MNSVNEAKRWEKIWDDVWRTGASGQVITWLREKYSGLLRNRLTPHIRSSSEILELGSGTGTLLVSLAPQVESAVGIDISDEALTIANQHKSDHQAHNVTFLKADCKNVPYENNFDLVWSAGLIEHFFDHDIDIVRQHLKALKPGGIAVISVPYAFSLHSLQYLVSRPRFLRWLWPWSDERHFQKFYSLQDLREIARQITHDYQVKILPPTPIGLLLGIALLEIRKPE